MNSDITEQRHGWRTGWLSSIQEFADSETQSRMWLDPTNTNPHWSFVEVNCCYFDRLYLSVGGYDWALGRGFICEEEVEAVAEFHKIAGIYRSPTDDYDHKAILEDTGWKNVVFAAKKAQLALSKLLNTQAELKLLLEP